MGTSNVADVIVVGAGIIGAACAFRLSERGLSVVVIDAASAPATGSTGKSAAGVRVQFSSETNVRLSWESIQEYRDFPELYGEESEYRPQGYLFLVPEAGVAEHRGGMAVQRRLGAPVEEVSLVDAAAYVPFDPSGVALATYGPADGVIDPHRTTLAYLRMARAHGCTVMLDSEVVEAERSAAGTWRVTTPAQRFEAPHVINAAGAWSGEVGRRAGLKVPVEASLRMVFTTGPTFAGAVYPLTVDVGSGFYLRSEGDRVLMGRSNPDQVPGFVEGIDWAWLEPTLESGMARFPWLEHATLDRRASWWGYYEVTPDHHPILGRMPGADGWLNACGFSGHGVQQAAAVGRVIAEEVVDGRASSIDIDAFRYQRFLDATAGSRSRERHIV